MAATRNVLSLFFLFTTAKAGSQTLEFRNYTTKDGLLSDETYNMHQDKEGYIWIFSEFGTVKYNGSGFRPVLTNLPADQGCIYSFYENESGRKWAANSNANIYEIRNDSAFMIKGFEKVSASLRKSVAEIGQLGADDNLNLYAITKAHTYKLMNGNGIYSPLELDVTREKDTIEIQLFEKGKLMFHIVNHSRYDEFTRSPGKKTVCLRILNTKQVIRLSGTDQSLATRKFKRFGEDIYFLHANSVARLSPGKKISYTKMPATILCYTRDKNRHIWVGCLNDGLYELNERDSIINHYFEHTTVNDVLIDHQYGLWVSTSDLGLFRCASLAENYFKKTEPLGQQISLVKKIKSKLFVANRNGDIFIFEKNKHYQVRQADNRTPLEIIENGDNYLILFKLRVEQINASSLKPGILIPQTWSQYNVLSKGSDTLIYSWRRGITSYIKGIPKKSIDLGQKILCCALWRNRILIGTENGAYLYNPVFQKKSRLQPNGDLIPDADILPRPAYLLPTKNCKITRIVAGDDGNIWFCTAGNGIFKLHDTTLNNFTASEGLPGNVINDISFKADYSMLLSTNAGLFLSKPLTNDALAPTGWKKVYSGSVKNAVEFENRIYFGSRNGLVISDEKKQGDHAGNLFFNLSSVKIDSKEVPVKDVYRLRSEQNSVEFLFDAITFADIKPGINYLLLGASADSGYVSDPVLKFTRLPPGNYTLSAFPAVSNGCQLKRSVTFLVEPAFYQTALFIAVVIASAVLCIILIVWFITRYTRKKAAARTKSEQLILEYKLIALKAQINPHFMSNCLSAIQRLIINNDTGKANFYVAKFGLLVRNILDLSSRPVVTLSEELDLLAIYVDLEQLRFVRKFTYEISVDRNVAARDLFVPPLILNPIVENAIWHGLIPVQSLRSGELHIRIRQEEDRLVIEVEDNGVGRDLTKKTISNNKNRSYGIKITEQRLTNINYLYATSVSKMIYEDITDTGGAPAGTRVTIYLPIILTPLQHEQD